MSQEQAAKYFIVAWVKDWKLKIYLATIVGEKNVPFYIAHESYKWLPESTHWFFQGTTRRYIADTFPKLNDLLWDADSNEKRLLLSRIVEKLNGKNSMPTSDKHKKKEVSPGVYTKKAKLEFEKYENINLKCGGHGWKTVK